jgi:hypothetical protein
MLQWLAKRFFLSPSFHLSARREKEKRMFIPLYNLSDVSLILGSLRRKLIHPCPNLIEEGIK